MSVNISFYHINVFISINRQALIFKVSVNTVKQGYSQVFPLPRFPSPWAPSSQLSYWRQWVCLWSGSNYMYSAHPLEGLITLLSGISFLSHGLHFFCQGEAAFLWITRSSQPSSKSHNPLAIPGRLDYCHNCEWGLGALTSCEHSVSTHNMSWTVQL